MVKAIFVPSGDQTGPLHSDLEGRTQEDEALAVRRVVAGAIVVAARGDAFDVAAVQGVDRVDAVVGGIVAEALAGKASRVEGPDPAREEQPKIWIERRQLRVAVRAGVEDPLPA